VTEQEVVGGILPWSGALGGHCDIQGQRGVAGMVSTSRGWARVPAGAAHNHWGSMAAVVVEEQRETVLAEASASGSSSTLSPSGK
jgi:hypothetical protein